MYGTDATHETMGNAVMQIDFRHNFWYYTAYLNDDGLLEITESDAFSWRNNGTPPTLAEYDAAVTYAFEELEPMLKRLEAKEA